MNQVILKFRTGQSMTLEPEKAIITHRQGTSGNGLFLDGVNVASLGKGSPNFDANNNFTIFNASPTTALYDLMPDDWDKTQSALRIIDEIFVVTNAKNVL